MNSIYMYLFKWFGYIPTNFEGIVEYPGLKKYYYINGKKYRLECWIGDQYKENYRHDRTMSIVKYKGTGIWIDQANYQLFPA